MSKGRADILELEFHPSNSLNISFDFPELIAGIHLRRTIADRGGKRFSTVDAFACQIRFALLEISQDRSFSSLYSIESSRAIRLASMMFVETPTVVQDFEPSVDLIRTRTRADVAELVSMTLTL